MRWAIDVWGNMAREYGATARLVIVYIEEAHAQDEWPISSARLSRTGRAVVYNQHTTQQQRIAACADFVRDYALDTALVTVATDLIGSNPFQTAYTAWPIRWFVLRAGAGAGAQPVVSTVGQPDDGSFDLMQVMLLLCRLLFLLLKQLCPLLLCLVLPLQCCQLPAAITLPPLTGCQLLLCLVQSCLQSL